MFVIFLLGNMHQYSLASCDETCAKMQVHRYNSTEHMSVKRINTAATSDLNVNFTRTTDLCPHYLQKQRKHVLLAKEIEKKLTVVITVNNHLSKYSEDFNNKFFIGLVDALVVKKLLIYFAKVF